MNKGHSLNPNPLTPTLSRRERGQNRKRRVCFVTGTRAEFGLMQRVLETIRDHSQLQLQLVVTGMHLHSEHGRSIDSIRKQGWRVDAVVPWKRESNDPMRLANEAGKAIAHLAAAYKKLKSDIILVTGDRVEAFAAATAAHISHRIVAHVHGGDRAAGQIDDSLRHAITKLSHIHFPATRDSAKRIARLGEDAWRIHAIGSPGIDGIAADAATPGEITREFPELQKRRFALIVLHPVNHEPKVEYGRARKLLNAVTKHVEQIVVLYPNNDPGSQQVIQCWRENRHRISYLLKDLPRPTFLGLLRDSAMLVGNSSSGIIEAASFGTPVVDIGPRQEGRLHSQNVTNVPYSETSIAAAVGRIWNRGRPMRWRGANVYGGSGTAVRIARLLASVRIDPRLIRKLIAY